MIKSLALFLLSLSFFPSPVLASQVPCSNSFSNHYVYRLATPEYAITPSKLLQASINSSPLIFRYTSSSVINQNSYNIISGRWNKILGLPFNAHRYDDSPFGSHVSNSFNALFRVQGVKLHEFLPTLPLEGTVNFTNLSFSYFIVC